MPEDAWLLNAETILVNTSVSYFIVSYKVCLKLLFYRQGSRNEVSLSMSFYISTKKF